MVSFTSISISNLVLDCQCVTFCVCLSFCSSVCVSYYTQRTALYWFAVMFSCIATLYMTLPTSPPSQPYLINIATLFKLQGVSEKPLYLVFCNFMASKGTRKVFFQQPSSCGLQKLQNLYSWIKIGGFIKKNGRSSWKP